MPCIYGNIDANNFTYYPYFIDIHDNMCVSYGLFGNNCLIIHEYAKRLIKHFNKSFVNILSFLYLANI